MAISIEKPAGDKPFVHNFFSEGKNIGAMRIRYPGMCGIEQVSNAAVAALDFNGLPIKTPLTLLALEGDHFMNKYAVAIMCHTSAIYALDAILYMSDGRKPVIAYGAAFANFPVAHNLYVNVFSEIDKLEIRGKEGVQDYDLTLHVLDELHEMLKSSHDGVMAELGAEGKKLEEGKVTPHDLATKLQAVREYIFTAREIFAGRDKELLGAPASNAG